MPAFERVWVAIASVFLSMAATATSAQDSELPAHDNKGRLMMVGPVHLQEGQRLSNVHIVSRGYGVIAEPGARVSDSVIEATICVRPEGIGIALMGNVLYCQLAVEFTGSVLLGNVFLDNRYSGIFSNRPADFGD